MRVEGERVYADTKYGCIEGLFEKFNGIPIAVFRGIPYAKQPIENLRFEPLQPLEPWTGVLHAIEDGPVAPQDDNVVAGSAAPQSEACIYLNIFVPLENTQANNPVLFHIHGGGFSFGSGSEPQYDMRYFAAVNKVVCVSINYRLGFYGLLYFPHVVQSNLALKDQFFALKWTNENISAFDGDPSQITLFGDSAGSMSVQLILMSRDCDHLYARAFMNSGVFQWWYWLVASKKLMSLQTKRILKQLGCPDSFSPELGLEFLKRIPAKKLDFIVKSVGKYVWLPVEDDVTKITLKHGVLPRKPLLIGTCTNEGKVIPDMAFVRRNKSKQTCVRSALGDVISIHGFDSPLKKLLATTMKEDPDFPVFFYVYDYVASNVGKLYPKDAFQPYYGACHMSDLCFFTGYVALNQEGFSSTDVDVCKAACTVLKNFITLPVEQVPMPLYTSETKTYTLISAKGLSHDRHYKPKRGRCVHIKALSCLLCLVKCPNLV